MATATATSYPVFHSELGRSHHMQIQTRKGSATSSPILSAASTTSSSGLGEQHPLSSSSLSSSSPLSNNPEKHQDSSNSSYSHPNILFQSHMQSSSSSRTNSGHNSSNGNSMSEISFPVPDHRNTLSSGNQTSSASSFGSSLKPFTDGRPRARSFTEKTFDTLAAPVSITLVLLCTFWYLTSVVSNTLNKTILNVFPYPVSLTMIQFFLSVVLGVFTIKLSQLSHSFYQLLPLGTVSYAGFRYPTKEIVMSLLPMAVFQLFGHVFSHKATSLIPVSLVHTIKALSPLFTVAAYKLIFGVQYSARTYLSLIPLTTGVILTCSTQFSSQMSGIIYALVASLIFVSQNIYSKKILTYRPESALPDADNTPRIDKLNVLCYCSSMAFIFTFPIWFFSEGVSFFSEYFYATPESFSYTDNPSTMGFLIFAFLLNGLSHFLQNMIAFQVLGTVSPVTYSVASLIKRIAIVTVSILWFGQQVSYLQQFGIVLTFGGLYLYDRLGGDKTKQKKYTNISLHQPQTLPR